MKDDANIEDNFQLSNKKTNNFNQMEDILLRISEIAEAENIKITSLERKIGASKGVLSRALNKNTDIQTKWISRIVDNYPQYSARWILTGKGKMLTKYAEEALPVSVLNETKLEYKSEGLKPIPFVTQLVAAGFGSDDFQIKDEDVKDYYVVPKFKNKHIDFMIEVTGSSMQPKYNSGDVIACTIIRESSFIQWNKTHVIATREQGILVKRIREGSDTDRLLAVSENSAYPPFEILKKEITGLAIVAGVIRLE